MTTKLTRQQVIDAIRDAFPETPLDADSAFGKGGTTYGNAESFISGTRGRLWSSLEVDFLLFHQDAIYFLAADAFPHYLPAYLTVVLRNYDDVDVLPLCVATALSRRHDLPGFPMYFDRRITGFTSLQRVVIARTLEQIEALFEPDFSDDNTATIALDSHWRQYLP